MTHQQQSQQQRSSLRRPRPCCWNNVSEERQQQQERRKRTSLLSSSSIAVLCIVLLLGFDASVYVRAWAPSMTPGGSGSFAPALAPTAIRRSQHQQHHYSSDESGHVAVVPMGASSEHHHHLHAFSRTRLFSTTVIPPPQSQLQLPNFFGGGKNAHHDEDDLVLQYLGAPSQEQQQSKKQQQVASTSVAASEYNKEQQKRQANPNFFDFEQRKNEWARKYTSVDALRKQFGKNRNPFFGDFDPSTTRLLYKSLLPKALLELQKLGGAQCKPQELAPLAYRARVAAKLYARERCVLPARIMANLYDGFRQWRKYGHFDTHGMSYQQLWNKYATLILDELDKSPCDECGASLESEDDLACRICQKILERSCKTNDMVDSLVLSDKMRASTPESQRLELVKFRQKLEQDIRQLLEPMDEDEILALQHYDNEASATEAAEPASSSVKAAARTRHHPAKKALTAERVKLLKRVARFRRAVMKTNAKHAAPSTSSPPSSSPSKKQRQRDNDTAAAKTAASYPWNHRTNKAHDRPRPWVVRQ